MEKVNVKLDNGAYFPLRAYEADAGMDLQTPKSFILNPMSEMGGAGKAVIDTGIHIEIPEGHVGLLTSKSGLCLDYEIIVGAGTIDSGFTGSIKVILFNLGKHKKRFNEGDKIAQLVILPIITPKLHLVWEMEDTDRGSNGFGSTGK